MSSCANPANVTVNSTSIPWAQAESRLLSNITSTSYLRPDTGGALLPWIYTVLIIVIHLPVVIIRVVRWEIVQSWCLVSTLFTVIVYTQAYISTNFDPAKILVWTPVVLVIDAGSMLQVFFLVIEAKKILLGDRLVIMEPPENEPNTDGSQASSGLLRHFRAIREPRSAQEPSQTNSVALVTVPNGNEGHGAECISCPKHCAPAPPEEELPKWKDPAVYSAAIAALLFIATLVLQLLGLAKAVQALQASPDPPDVRWCSTLFQPFGIGVLDGDCNVYSIDQNNHKGIGCIEIPGHWQRQWLKGTVAAIVAEIIAEFVDLLILSIANKSTKCCGGAVKFKRPWFTIFGGGIVLIVTLIYGINYASALPPGVTSRMTVMADSDGPATYPIKVTSAGLRGTLLGWNDGLFEDWNTTYFGTGF